MSDKLTALEECIAWMNEGDSKEEEDLAKQAAAELAAKDARIAAAEMLIEKWRDKNKVYGQYVCADELAAALAGEAQ